MDNIKNEDIKIAGDASKDFIKSAQDNYSEPYMPKSHLKKAIENKSKKTFIFSILGLIGIILLLFLFGQSLLINFSVFLGGTKQNNTKKIITENKPIYIPAPLLDPQTNATNSADITITGSIDSDDELQIRLLVNDELTDVLKLKDESNFTFSDITLNNGMNKIKAVAVIDGKTGDYSNVININYYKDSPSLVIEYPEDGAIFTSGNSTLTIKGKSDQGTSVRVNDYIAITKNDGSFTFNYTLQSGDNKLKLAARDPAGNITEKEITVSYSP